MDWGWSGRQGGWRGKVLEVLTDGDGAEQG